MAHRSPANYGTPTTILTMSPAALERTLKDLQTTYLDLYLVCLVSHSRPTPERLTREKIHWPVSFVHREGELFPKDPETKLFQHSNVPIKDTWKAMEELVSNGKVRSIGISNFTIEKTEEVLKTAKIIPAVNQIEAHPWLQQPELFSYLKSKVSLKQAVYEIVVNC